MHILVFMSDNRSIENENENEKEKAGYYALVAAINHAYCKKHNYDFIYYRPYLNNKNQINLYNCIDLNTNTLRHAAWSKLLSTGMSLDSNYDYVVYIDSDCIFKDFNYKLESIIHSNSDKDILFFNNKPWGEHVPCAGFYISKVANYTKQFFMDWYNVNIPSYNKKHAWEQDALWNIYGKYNIGILDTMMFRENEGQFLRHVGCCDETNHLPNFREKYFMEFINTHNINYAENIKEIKCIEFNTNIDSIIFENYPITNKSYSWHNNNDSIITFLENNEMKAFGWGYYSKINDTTFKACFGGKEHIIIFYDNYANFISTRCHDNEVIKGSVL
jgi:hypothetical protein